MQSNTPAAKQRVTMRRKVDTFLVISCESPVVPVGNGPAQGCTEAIGSSRGCARHQINLQGPRLFRFQQNFLDHDCEMSTCCRGNDPVKVANACPPSSHGRE